MNRRSFLLGTLAVAASTYVGAARIKQALAPVEIVQIIRTLRGDTPVGTVMHWAGAELPRGWLPCDGRVLSGAMFPELFAAIGNVYTQPPTWIDRLLSRPKSFALPDMRSVK